MRNLGDELAGARTIGDIAQPGPHAYDSTTRRAARLRDREGRRCTTCSRRLSIYNPARTCWACDEGIDPDWQPDRRRAC